MLAVITESLLSKLIEYIVAWEKFFNILIVLMDEEYLFPRQSCISYLCNAVLQLGTQADHICQSCKVGVLSVSCHGIWWKTRKHGPHHRERRFEAETASVYTILRPRLHSDVSSTQLW